MTVPGELGSFTVWENHAALISSLKEGELTARHKDMDGKTEKTETFKIDGGFVEVRDNEVSVCVERVLANDKTKETEKIE